jgi:DNA-binding transcriptional MerR regulator
MTTALSIHEAAEITGLSSYTLRYYEQIGLIDPVPRAGGARVYGDEQLRWIDFLICLRATGMSMRDMQAYAQRRREGDSEASVRERGDILQQHSTRMRAELATLTEAITRLDAKIALYRSMHAQALPERKPQSLPHPHGVTS